MLKLKEQFSVEFDMRDCIYDGASMTKIMPFRDGRAIGFGYGNNKRPTDRPWQPEIYWLAEISPDGIKKRVLPMEISEHFVSMITGSDRVKDITVPINSCNKIEAFRVGEKFGLLLASHYVYLFDDLNAQPRIIKIQNDFSALAGPKFINHSDIPQFLPVSCGNASGNYVPVVFASPKDRQGKGRHVSLLEIDETVGTAQWLHTYAAGLPRTTQFSEYAQFSEEASQSIRIIHDKVVNADISTLIYDCAWLDNTWLLYATGFDEVYQRSGMPLSVLTRNYIDLSLLNLVYRPGEACWGKIPASLDRLIINPYRQNGPRKGKTSVFTFADQIEHEVKFPKGCAKFVIEEHYDGCYWAFPNWLGWGRQPYKIVACREA